MANSMECEKDSFLFKQFNITEVIGCGGYGLVFKVQHKHDNQIYVLKVVTLPEEDSTNVTREVRSLVGLNHEHIVRYHTSWTDIFPLTEEEVMATVPEHLERAAREKLEDVIQDFFMELENQNGKEVFFIQMEYCQGITLGAWMNCHCHYNSRRPEVVHAIFMQILNAVDYIHAKQLMHRDLKPDNIIIGSGGGVKIVDFGLAKRVSSKFYDPNCFENNTPDIGTELYCSPEQKKGSAYDQWVDVHALGVILFELLMPFNTNSERIRVLQALRDGERIHYTNNFIDEFKLIKNMMRSGKDRISVQKVIARLNVLWLNIGI